MADITFLGLGQMGRAFASVMLKRGYEVAVWNRSPEAVEALAGEGAVAFEKAAEAVAASPVTVVCVSDYPATDAILRDAEGRAALQGKVLVQLSSGSPRLAKDAEEWVSAAGAAYLDGGIMVYPEDIGEPHSSFIIAGAVAGYERAKPLLLELAPQTEYLGPDAVRAAALDSAIICAAVGAIVGIVNGAAICEAAGVDLKQFAKLVDDITPTDVGAAAEGVRKIADGTLADTGAHLSTWAATMKPMLEIAEDHGYSQEVPRFFEALFKKGLDLGLGDQDAGALIAALRPKG
jgi:3-hydroxyisobutyrate dehydrogenase-like beta-hydroxyacid dehydrogenase